MKEQLTAVFQKVPRRIYRVCRRIAWGKCTGRYARGARFNLQEAVQLVLEANRALIKETLRDKTVIRETFAQIS